MPASDRLELDPATIHLDDGRVVRPDRDVPPVSANGRVLLRVLAAADGATVTREALRTAIWGEDPPTVAALTNLIRRIRDRIELDPSDPTCLLSVRGEGYRLRRPSYEAEASALVGRRQERSALVSCLDDADLVTLVGTGGVGKTALALDVVRTRPRSRFCDLAPARGPGDVLRRVGEVIGVPAAAADVGSAAGPLVARLREARIDLLVLDNVEQVLDTVRDLAPLLCAHTTVLLTSRTATGLPEEHVVAVGPLEEADAVLLFLDRATSEVDLDTARALVLRVDRIPLGIEILAAALQTESPAALLKALPRALAALRSDRRDHVERQRTLFALIRWSWSLLSLGARTVLGPLSVFRGGFTVSQAEAVLDTRHDVLDAILELRRHHLIRRLRGPGRRLDLYEPVRAFAQELLADDADPTAIAARHAEVFASGTASSGDDLDNVLVAFERAIVSFPEWVGPLAHRLCGRREQLHAAVLVRIGERAVRAIDDPVQVGRIVGAMAPSVGYLGDPTRARDLAEQALALAIRDEDRLQARMARAFAARQLGDLEAAESDLDANVSLARSVGLPALEAHAAYTLGQLRLDRGALQPARSAFERAHAASLSAGKASLAGRCQMQLGGLLALTEPAEAVAALDSAVEAATVQGNDAFLAFALAWRGLVAWAHERHDDATVDFEEADRTMSRLGYQRPRVQVGVYHSLMLCEAGRTQDAVDLLETLAALGEAFEALLRPWRVMVHATLGQATPAQPPGRSPRTVEDASVALAPLFSEAAAGRPLGAALEQARDVRIEGSPPLVTWAPLYAATLRVLEGLAP